MTNGVCKKDLMDQIYLYSFAVDDAKLFLDTHPEDEDALAYFYECSRMRNQALKEYVVTGIKTTIPFHQQIVEDEVFMSGNFNTGFIEDFYKRQGKEFKSE